MKNGIKILLVIPLMIISIVVVSSKQVFSQCAPANLECNYDTSTNTLDAQWDDACAVPTSYYPISVGTDPCCSETWANLWLPGSISTTYFSSSVSLPDGTPYCRVLNRDNGPPGYAEVGYVQITVDSGAPTCTMTALSTYTETTSFLIEWSGGTQPYDIQVKDDNGKWTVWQTGLNGPDTTYPGTDYHEYQIRCRPSDNTNFGPAVSTIVDTFVLPNPVTGISDGDVPGNGDLAYQGQASSISAFWNETVTDTDREYAIGTTSGGTEVVSWTELSNGGSPINAAVFTHSGLSLSEGSTYYFSLRSRSPYTTKTGATVTTNGVVVDSMAPTCSVTALSAWQTSTSFTVSWDGTDATSGVAQFDVQVQVNGGAWTDWKSGTGVTAGEKTDNYAGAEGSTYGFRCRAQDNAGNLTTYPGSAETSTGVDTTAPVVTNVYDGLGADETYTGSLDTISANWTVTESGSGIFKYSYAIGTTAGGTEVLGFTDNGTTTNVTNISLTLTNGTTYYVTVRAEDNAGLTGDRTSNGIKVDNSPPTASIDSPASGYVGTNSFDVGWSGSDGAGESGLYQYTIQYRENGGVWTDWAGSPTTDTFATFNGSDGNTYDFQIKAIDNAGNESSYPGTPNLSVTVASTRPDAPAAVYEGVTSGADVDLTTDNASLSGYWDAVTVSGGPTYAYALGTSIGGNDVIDWTETTDTFFTETGLSLADGTYYLSVKTRNAAGLWSLSATSGNGITVDTTPPTCTVTSLDPWQVFSTSFTVQWSGTDATSGMATYDVQVQDNAGGWTGFVTGSSGTSETFPGANGHEYQFQCKATDVAGNAGAYPGTAQTTTSVDTSAPAISFVYDGTGADESYLTSTTTLSVNWAATDDESGIQSYQYAVGTTSGGTDILSWTSVGTVTSVTNSGLTLSNATTYYVSVRANNNAGLTSEVTSNGILADHNAPATSMQEPSSEYSSTEDFTVQWSASDGAGESGVKEYHVQYKTDSGAWTDWTPIPTTETSRTFSGANGHVYYFRTKAQDNAGNLGEYTADPNGQASTNVDTTRLPAPANIFDGVTSGTDADYTTVTGSFSGYWDAVSGAVEYVYKIGTTSGGNDVVDITTTTSTSFTATGLTLTDGTKYYLSVEAKNISGLSGTTGTSDGITVDLTAPTCEVTQLSEWQSGSTSFTVEWSGTDSASGIANYDVQAQDNSGGWSDWQTSSGGTSATYSGADSHSYQFRCRATDNNGNTGEYPATAQTSTSVDTTAPSISYVYDGTGADESITSSGDTISANWAASDAESDIQRYEYAIGTTPGGTEAAAWTINGTEASFTLNGLNLYSGVTYYVSIKAYNNAGLSTSATSDGILSDTQPPVVQFTSPSSESIGTTTFKIEWSGTEAAGESGVKEYVIQHKEETGEWADWTPSPTTETSRDFSGTDGATYYFRIKAVDNAGNWSPYPLDPEHQLKTSIDTSKPSAPAQVYDGETGEEDYTSVADSFSGRWDPVQGAKEYSYAIGTSKGDSDVVTRTRTTETSFTETGLDLADGQIYYLSVHVLNSFDVWTSKPGVSDGVMVDTTPPATPVVEDDGDITADSSNLDFSIEVSDNESRVSKIWYAIGTAVNKTDVRDWTDIGLQTSVTASGLSLSPGSRYYILVKAENNAGLTSLTGTSNGINRVVGSNITFSYLPLELSVSSSNTEDVAAPIEMVIKESGGGKVIYTQVKRSYSIPGGIVIEDPITSASLTIQANEEKRVKTSVYIPARIVMMALGGVVRAEVIVTLNYIGTDSGGNAVSSVFRIPVKLTSSDADVSFTFGEIKITSPLPGQYVGNMAKVTATVPVAGVGVMKGQWILNGKSAEDFNVDITQSGDIVITAELEPLLEGLNRVALRVTSPEYRETDELRFRGTAVAARKLTEFWAGPISFTDVSATYNSATKTYTGTGKAKLPFSDSPVEVPFQNIYITRNGDKSVIAGAALADLSNYKIDKGALLLTVSTAMFTENGMKADGTIRIKGADGVPGIGPLNFYAVNFAESGINGQVRLNTPQKGRLGMFIFKIGEMDFSLRNAGTSVRAKGFISATRGPLNLSKQVVIETTPSGGLRFGKP